MVSNFQNPRSAAMDFPFGGLDAGNGEREANLEQGLVSQDGKTGIQTINFESLGNIPTAGVAGK